MKHQERGSAAIFIVIVILLLAVGLIAWRIWDQNRADTSPAHLRIGIFAPSLTTQVADAQGYLQDENITVEYKQVTGSEQQFRSLRDSEYDVILTSPDNVAHYRLNQDNALGGTFDVQAVAGTNRGQGLSLVVQPDIKSYEDLRGKTLAVDSRFSGFAYVLYQMMRNHGLEPDTDYQLTEAGGASARYDQLLESKFAGTLLLSGSELRAQAAGKTILEGADDAISNYLGGVVAARQSWASQNRSAVERLLRAYRKANDWIFDATNRQAAIALLQQSGLSQDIAEKVYEVQVSPVIGLIQDQSISQEEMRTVLKLRQDWGGFNEEQDIDTLSSPQSGLYDLSYQRASLN